VVVGEGALALEQGDLEEREGVDVGVAQGDRGAEDLLAVEEAVGAADGLDGGDGAGVLGAQAVGEGGVGAEAADVEVGDLEVGLGEHHLDLAEEVVEEGPLACHAAEQVEAAGAGGEGVERGADAEPARQHPAGLGPAEDPRDGADAGHGAGAALAPGGP
jgi:hypothetical protein